MTFEELQQLHLPKEILSLIQRGLNHAGFYTGTFNGVPGAKTKAAFQRFITGNNSQPKWIEFAQGEMGIVEFAGSADNPQVCKYLESVDSLSKNDKANDETAWCSAFVNWCMEKANIKGTEKANARSWLNWGKKLDQPKPGCVVILWRGSRTGWQGHVAFFVKESSDYVYLLGGNQSDAVNVSKYSKSRVLGYRWID